MPEGFGVAADAWTGNANVATITERARAAANR
jgi:hypothetical protein